MDPIVVSARQRYKEPKHLPKSSDLTPFQQKLQQNPYAHILASSVRYCGSTGVRLPSFFHVDLHVKLHPETRDPWFLPTTLSSASSGQTVVEQGPPLRLLARRVLLHDMRAKKRWLRATSLRLRDTLGTRTSRVVWREDMADLVLELLREVVVKKLRWAFQHKNAGLVVPCPDGFASVENHNNAGCVLDLRGERMPHFEDARLRAEELAEKADNLTDQVRKIREWRRTSLNQTALASDIEVDPAPRLAPAVKHPPLHFENTPYRGGVVPVYNLVKLLGKERVAELVAGTVFTDVEYAVLKTSKLTLGAQTWLYKLQIYLAESGV